MNRATSSFFWSREMASTFCFNSYISLNVFYATFRLTSFDETKDNAKSLSIINMTPVFFFGSSPEFLSRFVESVIVQLPTNSSLRENNVFRIHRATYICRRSSRPYIFSTRARGTFICSSSKALTSTHLKNLESIQSIQINPSTDFPIWVVKPQR